MDSIHPTFRISVPLVKPPAGMVNPADFVAALTGVSAATALRERADAIHHSTTGAILTYADGKETPVKDLAADAFWKSLNEGARWDSLPEVGRALACQPAEGRPSSAAEPAESPADLPLVAIREPQTPALVSP